MSSTRNRPQSIRLIEAVDGTSQIAGRQMRFINGTMSPQYFGLIIVPAYQRGQMLHHKHTELRDVLAPDGWGVPDDLTLCSRGGDFKVVGAKEILLSVMDDLFMLDGLQRLTASLARLAAGQKTLPLRFKILLNTTEREERELFYQANRLQTPVDSDVHLRNMPTNAAIKALREMAEASVDFPTVKWDQTRPSGEYITARMLYELTVILHGCGSVADIESIQEGLKKAVQKVGTEILAENMKVFFDLVKAVFIGTDNEPYMFRADLLRALAYIMNEYADFWQKKNPNKIFMSAKDRHKLGTLRKDVLVADLARSTATRALRHTLAYHIQKGRDHRLIVRGSNE